MILPIRAKLIGDLRDPALLHKWYTAGHAAVPGGHNACAATASQTYIELGIIHHVYTLAEDLSDALKHTGKLTGHGEGEFASAGPGDLVVCKDENHNGLSDHVWQIVASHDGGWYDCFDNEGGGATYRRRLDGADGKTPARGFLRLMV